MTRPMHRAHLLWIVALLAPTTSTIARAEKPPSVAGVREAAADFERGVRLYDQSNWRAALDAFREAYASVPNYKVQYNIGICLVRLNDSGGALNAFERYLADAAPGGVSRERRDEVESSIRWLREFLATRPAPAPEAGAPAPRRAHEGVAAPATQHGVGGIAPVAWASLGIAVVGLGLGAGFGIAALEDKGNLDRTCSGGSQCPPSDKSLIDQSQLHATLATTGFSIALIGLGTAAYAMIFANPPASAPIGAGPSVRAFVGVGSVGAGGTF
jgi:tetratricopeptide (TPR) repeat protein